MTKQTHAFQAQVKQILHLVTHSLYRNKEIFLRELFTGGSAVSAGSKKTVDDAKNLAAEALEAPAADIECKAGRFTGQALCERVAYDPETGQLQSASFMDYAMPHADGFLGFKTKFDTSIPCKTNALGVKGVGELGTIGATPAVVNAVIDALDHAGLGAAAEAIQMPVTAERVWRALQLKQFDPSPYRD